MFGEKDAMFIGKDEPFFFFYKPGFIKITSLASLSQNTRAISMIRVNTSISEIFLYNSSMINLDLPYQKGSRSSLLTSFFFINYFLLYDRYFVKLKNEH